MKKAQDRRGEEEISDPASHSTKDTIFLSLLTSRVVAPVFQTLQAIDEKLQDFAPLLRGQIIQIGENS